MDTSVVNGSYPKMDTSASQIPLATTELLELVLLHLDQGHILQLQRVNRFWFHTISGSPLLQQKLFFQPLPPSKAAGRSPELNPLLEPLFPFLFKSHPCLGDHVCQTMAEWLMQGWLRDFRRRRAILHPKASWRWMLPVQLAAPIGGVMVADYAPLDECRKNSLELCEVDPAKHASTLIARSNLGDNATMGLLYDIVLHYFRSTRHIHAGICVQWNMFQFTHAPRLHCFDKPKRLPFLCTSRGLVDQRFFPEYYLGVTPRNTITVHVSDVMCSRGCSWSTNYPGLLPLLRLPDGVLPTGNKANRYTLGNVFRSYAIYGKITSGVKSDLEVEESGKRRSEAMADLLDQLLTQLY